MAKVSTFPHSSQITMNMDAIEEEGGIKEKR